MRSGRGSHIDNIHLWVMDHLERIFMANGDSMSLCIIFGLIRIPVGHCYQAGILYFVEGWCAFLLSYIAGADHAPAYRFISHETKIEKIQKLPEELLYTNYYALGILLPG
jgi:hypothetical protein